MRWKHFSITSHKFSPEIGIGSNLVGIQTSRLSTYLHQTSAKGHLPKSDPSYCVHPLFPFIGSSKQSIRPLLTITDLWHDLCRCACSHGQAVAGDHSAGTLVLLSDYTVLEEELYIHFAVHRFLFGGRIGTNSDSPVLGLCQCALGVEATHQPRQLGHSVHFCAGRCAWKLSDGSRIHLSQFYRRP